MRRTSKSSRNSRPDIFQYHDYRKMLTDWLAHLRASQSGFSIKKLAKDAGVAAGYLSMVLSGKRDLSLKAFEKLSPFLSLKPVELSYFEQLIILGTSDKQEERLGALARMRRIGAYRSQNPKEIEVYQYLTHWYFVAIREMANLPDFKLEAEWIRERLRFAVDLDEIRAALTFLTQSGLLEISPEGRVRPPEKNLDCFGGVYRVALTQFHQEMLALASKSILTVPSAERSITGHALPIALERVDQAKAILSEALERIKSLQPGGNPDEVYFLEMAFFPLTQKTKRSRT